MEREEVIEIFKIIINGDYDEKDPRHVKCVDEMWKYHKAMENQGHLQSMTINKISESYRDDYPSYVLRMISRLKKRVKIL